MDAEPSLLVIRQGWFVVLVFVLVESTVVVMVLVESWWTAFEVQGTVTVFVIVYSISSPASRSVRSRVSGGQLS